MDFITQFVCIITFHFQFSIFNLIHIFIIPNFLQIIKRILVENVYFTFIKISYASSQVEFVKYASRSFLDAAILFAISKNIPE